MSLRIRRGGSVEETEGTFGEFGPTNGRASVIAAAVPRAVTKPSGASDVPVGQLNQATLNTAGTDGRLWLLPGTHNVSSSLIPLAGQWIAAPSDGTCIINGAPLSSGAIISGGNTGVRIQGGYYVNNDAGNGIYLSGTPSTGSFTVEDVTSSGHSNVGIAWSGSNTTIRYCYTHTNGRYGINGTVNNTATDPRYVNNRVEHCHIYNNNTLDFPNGGDASGTKFVWSDGIYLGFNYAHGNNGCGLWTDFGFRDATIEENVCENNANSGIFFEASYGTSVIQRNHLKDNGFGTVTQPAGSLRWQLAVAASNCLLLGETGLTVQRNTIDTIDPGRGIVTWNHDGHPQDNRGVTVTNNDIWLRGSTAGTHGGFDGGATKTLWTEATNTWTVNKYHVTAAAIAANTALWLWGSGTQSSANYTFAQWQAAGKDTAGTRVAI